MKTVRKSRHINITIETSGRSKKKIQESPQLNVLVETLLSGNQGGLKRCCAIGKLIQAANMYTETNMYSSVVRGVADAAYELALHSKGRDVFRVSVSNPPTELYYVGDKAQITRRLKKLMGAKA